MAVYGCFETTVMTEAAAGCGYGPAYAHPKGRGM